MKLILKQNTARNFLKCVFQPIIIRNAFETKSGDNTPLECPRVIYDAFLCKRSLLTTRNTVLIQKQLRTPRDYFSSLNILKSHLKRKGIPRTSMRASFNRGLCKTQFIASVIQDPPKTWFQNKINKELP